MIRVKGGGNKVNRKFNICASTSVTALSPDGAPLSEVPPSVHHHVVHEHHHIQPCLKEAELSNLLSRNSVCVQTKENFVPKEVERKGNQS